MELPNVLRTTRNVTLGFTIAYLIGHLIQLITGTGEFLAGLLASVILGIILHYL